MDTPSLNLIPLSSLPEKAAFTSNNFAGTHAPPPMIQSVWATLQLLAPAKSSLSYAPSNFALVSSNANVDDSAAFHVMSYLEEVTRASYEVASSLMCSSVLAGRGSESDEHGDVGVWIGSLSKKAPEEILSALGLDQWVKSKGGKIVEINRDLPSALPSSLVSMGISSSSNETPATPKIHMDSLSSLLNDLDSPIEFRVEGLPGGVVLYFLVGKLSKPQGGFEKDDGYAGLVGAGIMADYDE